MTDLDRVIIRAWSALTVRGVDASPRAIAAFISVDVEGVTKRMLSLRARGALP